MVSPWSREYAEGGEVAIPVVADGDDAEPSRTSDGGPGSRSGRNLAAAVAGLSAIVAVGALAVVSLDGDDEVASSTSTPLPVLETLPLAERSIDATIELRPPVFDRVAVGAGGELDDYDLAAAIADTAEHPPSLARLEIKGVAPVDTVAVKSVAVTRDPATGLDELVVQSAGVTTSWLVDHATATTYTTSSTGNWVGRWLAYRSEVPDAPGTNDLTALVDAVVAGPITNRVLESGTAVADDGLVELDDGSIARRYRVDVVIDDEIAPPAALTFATLDGPAVASGDLPHSLAFDVYVTDRPSLRLITSRFEVDGEPIVFTQYFEQATTGGRLGLPPNWAIIEVT